MERQLDRQVMRGEIIMQPQHYTEHMTWYTPETEVDVQTVREELGSRAMELTVATEPLTEAATDVRAKDQDATEFGDSERSTSPNTGNTERKLRGMDKKSATYEELLDELKTARWIANAALIADRKGSPTSARVKQREYRQNRKAMPSRFSGGVVATGFGSL